MYVFDGRGGGWGEEGRGEVDGSVFLPWALGNSFPLGGDLWCSTRWLFSVRRVVTLKSVDSFRQVAT